MAGHGQTCRRSRSGLTAWAEQVARPALFEPNRLANLSLANRIVAAPICQPSALAGRSGRHRFVFGADRYSPGRAARRRRRRARKNSPIFTHVCRWARPNFAAPQLSRHLPADVTGSSPQWKGDRHEQG